MSGFLWEVLIFLFKDGNFRNQGFLYGPWLPVYGAGAVLFYLLLGNPLQRILYSKPVRNHHPVTIFFPAMLIGSLLELGIGYFLDRVWRLRCRLRVCPDYPKCGKRNHFFPGCRYI